MLTPGPDCGGSGDEHKLIFPGSIDDDPICIDQNQVSVL
jgi:hypothetical protein